MLFHEWILFKWLTISQKLFRANSPWFSLTIWELASDFESHLFPSKHSVLFSRLICTYFVNFFKQVFLIVTLSVKTVIKVLFLVFKFRIYYWLIDWLIDWLIVFFIGLSELFIKCISGAACVSTCSMLICRQRAAHNWNWEDLWL